MHATIVMCRIYAPCVGLDHAAVTAVCDLLTEHAYVKKIDLSENPLGSKGAVTVGQLIQVCAYSFTRLQL